MAVTWKALNRLKTAFRKFDDKYNRGERYFAFDVPGAYHRMNSTDATVPRMTILQENMGWSGDTYVAWDTLWNPDDAFTHTRMVDLAHKSGVRIHGLMMIQE
jgi:hypothetical protein